MSRLKVAWRSSKRSCRHLLRYLRGKRAATDGIQPRSEAKRDAIQELQDEKALRHSGSLGALCWLPQTPCKDALETKLEKRKKENRDLKEEVEESRPVLADARSSIKQSSSGA